MSPVSCVLQDYKLLEICASLESVQDRCFL